ncbi:MAG TPA: YdcF family protein, partial [Luteolibacter sp.]|nr:YdcF family protein [Luteolibacter sp.]
EAKAVMDAKGLQSAIIVSDPLHLKRASEMAEDLGMSTVCSPTPTTRYRSLGTKLRFLMRELYFLHHYHFTGQ